MPLTYLKAARQWTDKGLGPIASAQAKTEEGTFGALACPLTYDPSEASEGRVLELVMGFVIDDDHRPAPHTFVHPEVFFHNSLPYL